jgi:hypothetical protein
MYAGVFGLIFKVKDIGNIDKFVKVHSWLF